MGQVDKLPVTVFRTKEELGQPRRHDARTILQTHWRSGKKPI